MRPILLDLFCGAGGAAMGYQRAGFDVFGVDINPQPNYPFTFYRDDALEFLQQQVLCPDAWGVAAIHASPPCQRYTTLARGNNANEKQYPDLVAPTRELLKATGLPYVIENVPAAPLSNPITLCGEMFGLDVIRHREFESNSFLMQPPHPFHRGKVAGWRHGKHYDGPYFAVYGAGGGKGSMQQWRDAMGIQWMQTRHELAESIPPAYTEFVGQQLIQALELAA